MRRVSLVAWSVAGTGIVLMSVGVGVQAASGHGNEGGWIEHLGLLTAFASFPIIGALVASRRPRNPLGWIFLGIGFSMGLLVLAMEYAHVALVLRPETSWPGATLAAWLEQWLWYPGLMSIVTFSILLFPNGRPPSPRWRWLVWASGGCIALISITSMIESRLVGEAYSIDNPIGFAPYVEAEEALAPFFAVYVALTLACLSSLIVRFRRARGEERQQLKLLTYAAILFVISVVVGDMWDLPDLIFPLVVWTLPVSMGVAILKYRLFDVDIVINRTLVYGLLSGVLAATYLGSVVILQRILDSVTAESDLAVAGSTLVVAAAFRPLRSRIQSFIDQRFYRRKYDASATLEQFSGRLREQVDIDSLSNELVAVVGATMQPAHTSLWLRPPEEATP